MVRGETADINGAVFAEVNYHAAYEPKRAVRIKRWKPMRHSGDRVHPVLLNCDDGPNWSCWVKNGWASQIVAPEELYDLIFAPNERNNLAGDAAHQASFEEMRKRLDARMRSTHDPLLRGPVKAPAGARFNGPHHISPPDPAKLLL